MPQEGAYRITIGSEVLEYASDDAAIKHNILMRDNHGAEAQVDVEDDDFGTIAVGDLMTIELVPWGGSAYEQFFYGEVFDLLPAGPNTITVLARDVFEFFEEVDCDTVFSGTIHENEEFDIFDGLGTLVPYADLGVDFDDVIQPLTRVQVVNPQDQKFRPTTFSATPNITTMKKVDATLAVATRFIAEDSRTVAIRLEGKANILANYDYLIVDEDAATGFADVGSEVYKLLNINPLTTSKTFFGPIWSDDHPFRLRPGRAYWVIIRPNNPGGLYDFEFYSSPASPSATVSGKGMASVAVLPWVWTFSGDVGHLQLQWLPVTTVNEDKQWVLEEDGGTGNAWIRFGGTENFYPNHIEATGPKNSNGARVFFFELNTTLSAVLSVLLTDKCNVDYKINGSLDIPIVEALEDKCGNVIRSIMEAFDWHIRQLHRTEGLDNPPKIISEVLPSFGSPVLDLKHGDDTTDYTNKARVISESLKLRTTTIFTGIRVLGKDSQNRLIYVERHKHQLEQDLKQLSKSGTEDGLRKVIILRLKNATTFSKIVELADQVLALSSIKEWTGDITADGYSWVVPGQTILFEKSRKGIPETEMRVKAVRYTPYQTILTVNSLNDDLSQVFNRIDREFGKVEIVQTLTVSDLTHQFFAHARGTDNTFNIPRTVDGELQDLGGTPVSDIVRGNETPAEVIGGNPSQTMFFYFPPESIGGNRGKATHIKIYDATNPALNVRIQLDNPIYHWSDNGCAVSVQIKHT